MATVKWAGGDAEQNTRPVSQGVVDKDVEGNILRRLWGREVRKTDPAIFQPAPGSFQSATRNKPGMGRISNYRVGAAMSSKFEFRNVVLGNK